MKNRNLLFLTITCLFASQVALAQPEVTKSFAGPAEGATCPGGVGVQYQVSKPSGFGACTITWTITNGQKQSESGNTVTVIWNDTPGAKGTVTATFSNCGSGNEGNNGVSKNLSELILSVKNQAWGQYTPSINIDFCSQSPIYITVPHMYVLGTGGIAEPPLQEVQYQWTLPPGWKDQSTGATGEVITYVHFINIYPSKCALKGNVIVEGIINNRCSGAAPSAKATITLNGINEPVITVSAPGFTGTTSCNNTPVTFYAIANISLGCFSNWSWTYPESWTPVGSSGNSITLRPSGVPADSNPINAYANYSCNSSIKSANYVPSFIQPAVAGPNLICSSGSFSVVNAQGVSITWSSNNTGVLTINSSGVASRVANNIGGAIITASFPCAVDPVTKSVWVGQPSPPASIIGNTTPSVGSTEVYLFSNYPNSTPGSTSHTWILPYCNGCTFDWVFQGTTNSSQIMVNVGDSEGYIQAMGINSCGTGGASLFYVTPDDLGDGPMQIIAASPNPIKNSLNIMYKRKFSMPRTVSNSTEPDNVNDRLEDPVEYYIHDLKGMQVLYHKTNEFSPILQTQNLTNGIYFLTVKFHDGKIVQKRIVVEK